MKTTVVAPTVMAIAAIPANANQEQGKVVFDGNVMRVTSGRNSPKKIKSGGSLE